MTTNPSDEAMLDYLAGDEAVLAAAREIWDASGRIVDAQRDLDRVTKGYQVAIACCGIPAEHVERLGATLVLRLNRARLLDEADRADRLPDQLRDDDPQ
jgi:hypothetical protein